MQEVLQSVKIFTFTLVLVFLMQVQFNNITLEDRLHTALHVTAKMTPLQKVADGGAKLIQDAGGYINKKIRGNKVEAPRTARL